MRDQQQRVSESAIADSRRMFEQKEAAFEEQQQLLEAMTSDDKERMAGCDTDTGEALGKKVSSVSETIQVVERPGIAHEDQIFAENNISATDASSVAGGPNPSAEQQHVDVQVLEDDLGRMTAQVLFSPCFRDHSSSFSLSLPLRGKFVEMKERLAEKRDLVELLADEDENGLKLQIVNQSDELAELRRVIDVQEKDKTKLLKYNSLLAARLDNKEEHLENLEKALAESQAMCRKQMLQARSNQVRFVMEVSYVH